MKKIYTSVLMLTIGCAVSFAQSSGELQKKEVNTSKYAERNVVSASSRSGVAQNCSLSEGFDTAFPTGWTNVAVNASENWVYAAANGNPGGNMSIVYDANVALQNESIITPAQDLSALNSPGLYFDWLASYYWAVTPNDNYDLIVSISTDGGANFTPLWSEEDAGEFTSFTWYTKVVDLSAYASETAAIFKFNYYGTDGAQAGLDNIAVCEQSSNDLRLDQVLTGDVMNDYLYSKIPVSQAVEIIAGAIITNFGVATQTNVSLDWTLTLDGASVASGTTPGAASMVSNGVDTVWISTGYTPITAGELVISVEVSAAETENVPADNTAEASVMFTDYVWGHDFEAESYNELGYAASEPDGADGFEMGARYLCQADGSTIYSLQFALSDNTTSTSIICKVYEDATTAGAVSQTIYDIQPGDLSSGTVHFINVVLDDPVAMTAGSVYSATVEIQAGDNGFMLGNYVDDNDGGQTLYLGGADTWYNWIGLTTSMRLNLDPSVGIVENEDVASVSIYPNPTSDNVNINFVSKEDQDMTINVISVDGSLVFAKKLNTKVGQSSRTTIDVANLASGIYMVQLMGANSSLTQRIVVQ